jgi:hypothetical protein
MTNYNATQSQNAIGNLLVVPTNEACIKGIDHSEIESLLSVINLHNLDNYENEIKLVRLFVKKLHKRLQERESYKAEVINGLRKTKDDYTFLSFVSIMREGLWY